MDPRFGQACRFKRVVVGVVLGMCFHHLALVGANDLPLEPAFGQEESNMTCDDVVHVPRDEMCSFSKEHCSEDSVLNLIPLYYCYGTQLSVLGRTATVMLAIFLLFSLFRIMGHTADEYFSSILSQISQDMGLPPRLGGVTLLALGNGAPDLSSSVAAVRSGKFYLALGSAIGSVMFVGCVVAGRLISINSGVKSRGAQIRDIVALLLAVIAILVILLVGRMTFASVCVLVSLYAVYVLVVAIADFSKKAGFDWANGFSAAFSTPEEEDDVPWRTRVMGALLPRLEEEGMDYETIPHDLTARDNGKTFADADASVESIGTSSELEMTESPRKLGPVSDRATWTPGGKQESDARKEAPVDTQVEGTSDNIHRSVSEPPLSPQKGELNYEQIVHMSTREYRRRALADMSDVKSSGTRSDDVDIFLEGIDEEEEEDVGESSTDLFDHIESQPRPSSKHVRFQVPLEQPEPIHVEESRYNIQERKFSFLDIWKQASCCVDILMKPFDFVLRATIPLLEYSSYERSWFLISCALSPLWVCIYLQLNSWAALGISLGIGTVFSLVCWIGTQGLPDGSPPYWDFGTGYPIGASLIALFGFAAASMWIDVIATEIVGILNFFGVLGGFSPAILGLTILAWGNSLTDFVANISMAARSSGGISMAMTACFAGPLFNVLLGLGLGFLAYFADSNTSSAIISCDPVVIIGCIFSIIYCVGIVCIAISHGKFLPWWVGWGLMGWYAVYMIVIVALTSFR